MPLTFLLCQWHLCVSAAVFLKNKNKKNSTCTCRPADVICANCNRYRATASICGENKKQWHGERRARDTYPYYKLSKQIPACRFLNKSCGRQHVEDWQNLLMKYGLLALLCHAMGRAASPVGQALTASPVSLTAMSAPARPSLNDQSSSTRSAVCMCVVSAAVAH